MNKPQPNFSVDRPTQPTNVSNMDSGEDTPEDQNDLDVNKGIVKNIDELAELIEENHPTAPEAD